MGGARGGARTTLVTMGVLKTLPLTPVTLKATMPLTRPVILLMMDSERVILSGVAPTTIRTVTLKVWLPSRRRLPEPKGSPTKSSVQGVGVQPSSKLSSPRMSFPGEPPSLVLNSRGSSNTVCVGGGGEGGGRGLGGSGDRMAEGHGG